MASDPTKMTVAREFLKASDELLLSSVENVRDAVKAEAEKNRAAMEAMERRASERMDTLRAQSEAQAKVLQDQVAQLTSMMAAVLGQRTGAAAETTGVTLDFGRRTEVFLAAAADRVVPSELSRPLRSQSRPSGSRTRKRRSRSGKRRIPRPSLDPARRDAGRGRRRRLLTPAPTSATSCPRWTCTKTRLSAVAWSPTLLSSTAVFGDLVDNDDLHLLTRAPKNFKTDSFIGIITDTRPTLYSSLT